MVARNIAGTRRVIGEPLSVLIADYLRAAEAGGATDGAGNPISAAGSRSLRRALVHVDAVLGGATLDVEEVDDAVVHELAWRVVYDSGLPPSRVGSIVDALNGLRSYARSRTPDAPGAPPRPPVQMPAQDPFPPEPPPEPQTPTSAMLLLGARTGALIERLIVLAFVLTALALALALA